MDFCPFSTAFTMAPGQPQRRGFRQRSPPFLKYLQSILHKYPDGGQILKELVQNADDAHASKVVFLYDERSYGTCTLVTEELKLAQGPALLAYNDGVFSEEDWDGIQSTGDSHKLHDPSTVGRFGLGFNSVYHITDLPAVLSGSLLGMLDPQRAVLEDGGMLLGLEDAVELADQFQPFWKALEVLGHGEEAAAPAKYFPGTLFRFPLRRETSAISDNLYSSERIRQLFQAFLADAPICLLFLRHVRCVALKIVASDGTVVELLEAVAAPHPLNGPSNNQDTAAAAKLVSVACRMAVSLHGTATGKEPGQDWLVVSVAMKAGAFPELEELAGQLGSAAEMALAYPLRDACIGRLCCFLPLPATEENVTRLPLHVNAPFHLTDDRRHVKWAEEDQERDGSARWNQMLAEEVLPLAYRHAVASLAHFSVDPYGIWPDPKLSQHQQRYQSLVTRICRELTAMEVLVSADSSSLRRLQAADAIFLPEQDATGPLGEALERVLLQAREPLARIPSHVRRALVVGAEDSSVVREATRAYVRGVLKHVGTPLSPTDKRLLLEYVAGDKQYQELEGLPLLPRADGGFVQFGDDGNLVYADSQAFPRTLLPGLAQSFLPQDLTATLMQHLHWIAEKKLFRNLVLLDPRLVVQSLKESLPAHWYNQDGSSCVTWHPDRSPRQPPRQWLQAFWGFLEHHVPSLTQLEGHPLIPLSPVGQGDCIRLARLTPKSTFLFQSRDEHSLPVEVVKVLGRLGCTVIPSWDLAFCHRQLTAYILVPTPGNVLRAFANLGVDSVVDSMALLSSDQVCTLRLFLSWAPASSLSHQEAEVLGSLPIFKKMRSLQSPHPADLVPARNYPALERNTVPMVPKGLVLPKPVLYCQDEADRRLLLQTRGGLLGAAELALQAVQAIEAGAYARWAKDARQLLLWVLRNGDLLWRQSPKLRVLCQNLAFLDCGGSLARASDLFDPTNKTFLALLPPKRFPPTAFQERAVLNSLRALGLRVNETGIDPSDMLEAAQAVSTLQKAGELESARKKSQALIQLCNQAPVLDRFSWKELQQLQNLAWVLATDPTQPQMTMVFFPPKKLRSAVYVHLVGLAMALTDAFGLQAEERLGLSRLPPSEKVKENLMCMVRAFQPRDAQTVVSKLHGIYQHMQQYLDDFRVAPVGATVWNGVGFSLPEDVVLSFPEGLDLSHLIQRVPQDFLPYRRLFLAWGVPEAVAETDVSQALCQLAEEIDARLKGSGTGAELRLVIAILDWLKSRGYHGNGELMVPVQGPQGDGFTLRPASSALYCDIDWASLGNLGGEEADLAIVHEAVSPTTATFLGVELLSTRVLQPELFEAWGPSEPITLRIHNILREYSEEADLFKELLQNAEDAGARACRFLLDLRQPRNGGSTAGLLDPGMAACHGPALWAYNNALFTKEDLVNITRVGSASKERQEGKIGKFGLGFNTVYHVTDVPSILSGSILLIFDPNVTHLRKHIPNPACPGIRLDLHQRPVVLSTFAEQFQPYWGVFGCQVQEPFDFPGTLFRLPFRTEEEARESRICQEAFHMDQVEQLQCSFQDSCHLLLLFLRRVQEVSLGRLLNGAPSPEAAQPLALLQKEEIQNFCAKEVSGSCTMGPASIEKLMVRWELDCTESHYLVHTCVGTGESLAMFQQGASDGIQPSPPAAGVALPLTLCSAGKWAPDLTNFEGRVFCFLPLPIVSGLPLHIHGTFAVQSNRKGLWDTTAKGEWNHVLLRDAVLAAWFHALAFLREMDQEGVLKGYEYHTFWPDTSKARYPFTETATTFYRTMADGMSKEDLVLFSNGQRWCTLKSACFLDTAIVCHKQMGQMAARVFARFLPKPFLAVPLPDWVRAGFQASGHKDAILANTYDWRRFYQEIVFANLARLETFERNDLVLHALDMSDPALDQLLVSIPCIPTSPQGQLELIGKLVHPTGRTAPLYDPEDGCFPMGPSFLMQERLSQLERLGMARDSVPMEELIGRAHTVQALWQQDCQLACQRSRLILELLQSLLKETSNNTTQVIFRTIPFLPATLPSAHRDLCPPADLFLHKHRNLVGLIQPILAKEDLGEDLKLSLDVQSFLGLSRKPTSGMVLQQLRELCQGSNAMPRSEVQMIAQQCYAYLDKLVGKQPGVKQEVAQEGHAFPFIFVGEQFVPAKVVAHMLPFDASPYLHKLPQEYKEFKVLWECIGLQENFSLEDYILVLQELAKKKSGEPLSEEEKKLVLRVVNSGLMETVPEGQAVNTYQAQGIFFPDQCGVLRPLSKLRFDDTPWLPREKGTLLCHVSIARDVAMRCGIPTTKHRVLERGKIMGLELTPWVSEFGAREDLKTRLQNILREYSSTHDVLKELLQNADDAGASQIHFVWDRRHHPTERIFPKDWAQLQGPALCVYNDKLLQQKDIEGIQRLGCGGKGGRQDMTGKYGLGFNTVYHLTDCPAFLTGDSALGVFDPNLFYLPTATEQFPGAMFSINSEFKKTFPHVYDTFLPSLFDLSQGVLFRLPLRTAEGAVRSRVCQQAVRERDIQDMLEELKKEADSLVLFLNHLRTVIFSEIPEDGELPRELLRVETEMREEYMAQRQDFQEQLSQMAAQRCQHGEEAKPLMVAYNMKVRNNGSTPCTHWVVVRQVGVQDAAEESPDIARLPHGAVAACLDVALQGSAFCTLPLPVKTGLPVHINGNFAVDSARRDLHKANNRSPGEAWNDFLLRCVLTPLYCELLEQLRQTLGQEPLYFSTLLACSRKLKSSYLAYFPTVTECVPPYWQQLVRHVYHRIEEKCLPLLPVYQRETASLLKMDQIRIKWTTLGQGDLTQKPYFLLKEMTRKMDCILQSLGMRLVPAFQGLWQIHDEFARAGVKVLALEPSSLCHFLKALPLSLPCPLSETVLKDKSRCSVLLDFCMELVELNTPDKDLEGLPLLVTQDGMLRQLCSQEPVFYSKAYCLFPQQYHRFFDCSMTFRILCLKDQGFLQDFTLQEAAQFVQEVVGCPGWESQLQENQTWLQEVWSLFDNLVCQENRVKEDMKKAFENLMSLLKDLAVLPVCHTQSKTKHLVPLSDLPSILYPSRDEMFKLLSKLGFANMDIHLLPSSITVFCIQPRTLQPDDLPALLGHLATRADLRWNQLNSCETNSLLQFFLMDMEKVVCNQALLAKFRSLPLFQTHLGNRVALTPYCNVYVLDTKIAKSSETFKELYQVDEQTVWLQNNEINQCLSQSLKLPVLNDLQHFIQHLLPCLPSFSERQLQDILKLLFEIQKRFNWEEHQDEKKIIFTAFQPIRFIRDRDGVLRQASYFYDQDSKLFKDLGLEAKFVPKVFFKVMGVSKPKVHNFLLAVGMKKELSKEDFLKLARQIEQKAVLDGAMAGSLPAQREALLCHLLSWKSDSLQDSFLQQVSTIRFLIPQEVPARLSSFHLPFAPPTQPVALKGAVLHSDGISSKDTITLAWTAVVILSLSPVEEKSKVVLERLGVLFKLPTMLVATNLANVCRTQCKTEEDRKMRTEALMCMYAFLQDDLDNFDAACLAGVPSILVKGEAVAEPSQVVISLRDEQELCPYLFTTSPQLGFYTNLLQKLGVELEPSLHHYIRTLSQIYRETKDKESLQPNLTKTVLRATQHLFQLLHISQKQADFSGVEELHLPCTDGKLYPSNTLVYNNCTFCHFRKVLEQTFHFLVDLSKCHLPAQEYQHGKLVQLLPQALRPKMLSEITKQRLEENLLRLCHYGDRCKHQRHFQRLLVSQHFQEGLMSLLRWQSEEEVGKEARQDWLGAFSGEQLEVVCCKEIWTVLVHQAKLVEGSQHQRVVCVSRDAEGRRHIHLQHWEKATDRQVVEVTNTLATEVNSMLGEMLLPNSMNILREMLACKNPSEVAEVLKDKGVPLQPIPCPNAYALPPTGEEIPEEWHDCLDMSILNTFSPHDYVGYLDPAVPGERYLYAVVLELLKGGQVPTYRIDLGAGRHEEVTANDLYQFKRSQPKPWCPSTAVVPVLDPEGQSKEREKWYQKSLAEIKKEVDACLVNLWALPDAERRKAIRRLYLRYHPDKNVEREELANEVCKYLQDQIQQLEENGNLQPASGTSPSPHGFRGSRAFWGTWDKQAHRHRQSRQQFTEQAGGNFHYDFWSHQQTKAARSTQAGEATRWFRQAESDLRAACHDVGQHATEWVFYKVHRAVEKALAAAIFSHGEPFEPGHMLDTLAQKVAAYAPQLEGVLGLVDKLGDYGVDSNTTQYPSYHHPPTIPNEAFPAAKEQEVLRLAQSLLDVVQVYMSWP